MSTTKTSYNSYNHSNVAYLIKEEDFHGSQDSFTIAGGIIFIDRCFRLKNLNKEAEKFFGIDKLWTVGKKTDDIFKHCGENFTKIFNQVFKEGTLSTALNIKVKDRQVYVHIEGMKLTDDSGQFIGIIITIHDLSSVRAAIKQIQITQMLMSLGELAAGVAHHVRTPITTISGYLQVMLGRLENDKCAVSRNVIETLLEEVSCINNVVKELILFAKPPVVKEDLTNINKIIEEALLLVFRQLGGDKINIEKNLSPNLPCLTIDGNLMKQAIVNVMQNALEAMPDEGVLTVRSWLNSELNMVVFSIADTGSGVPTDILARIFEPFYTSKLDRMGLGLPVAHRIITEHGGFINVNSNYNGQNGVSIHIYLPIVEDKRSRLHLVQQQILNLQ